MRLSGNGDCNTKRKKQRRRNDLNNEGRYQLSKQINGEQQSEQDFRSKREDRAECRDTHHSAQKESHGDRVAPVRTKCTKYSEQHRRSHYAKREEAPKNLTGFTGTAPRTSQQNSGETANRSTDHAEDAAKQKQVAESAAKRVADIESLILQGSVTGISGDFGARESRDEGQEVSKGHKSKKHDQAADETAPETGSHSGPHSPELYPCVSTGHKGQDIRKERQEKASSHSKVCADNTNHPERTTRNAIPRSKPQNDRILGSPWTSTPYGGVAVKEKAGSYYGRI
jgi:hypothetical protein